MPRFVLIGLCEPPSADQQAQFDEWFVDQHIEDTAKCPNFVRGSVYKLEAPSYEEAERVLNEWQRDPDAWEGRRRHLATAEKFGGMPLRVRGSGWYEFIKSFDGPGPSKS